MKFRIVLKGGKTTPWYNCKDYTLEFAEEVFDTLGKELSHYEFKNDMD